MIVSRSKNGNALFLILIAVALFAALSYAVTQSGRGGGAVSREQAELKAARLTQFAGSVQQAIDRMMMLNGCTLTTLSFDLDPYAGGRPNPSSPADLSCDVYATEGGGVPVPVAGHWPATEGWTNGYFTVIGGHGSDSMAADCPGCELTLAYYLSFSDLQETVAVCQALNRHFLGDSSIPVYAGDVAYNNSSYAGVFEPYDDMMMPAILGKYDFCYIDSDTPPAYVYVHILVAR